MSNDKTGTLKKQLSKLRSIDEQIAVVQALEAKRREKQFVSYWEATPRQKDIFPQFTEDVKIFGVLGGNRSGKTELGAFITVAVALGKQFFKDDPAWEYVKDLPIPEPPCNIWVVGLDYPVLRDVIWREKLLQGRNHPALIPREALAKQPNEADFQILFANGSRITGKSADSGREKFQSASVDFVWIDEEPEVEIFNECYQRTIDCGGKILITLTPLTDIASGVRTPWVHDLYEDSKTGAAKDAKFVQLSVMDNPFVPEAEKVKLVEKWSGHPEERARLYGDFVQRSGLVYNMYDPKVHLEEPFPIPRDWRRVVSIDPANTGVTAALWGAVDYKGDLHLYREYYERDKVISEHAKNILVMNGGEPVDIWLIDPKWGTQRDGTSHKTGLQLYVDAGLKGLRLATPGEDYGMGASREYMNATVVAAPRHPRLKIFRDLEHFKHEVTHYTWGTFGRGEMKGLSKEKPTKRNDHLMNAFQYLCALKPKPQGSSAVIMDEDARRRFAQVNSYS